MGIWWRALVAALISILVSSDSSLLAQSSSSSTTRRGAKAAEPAPAGPKDYRSQHFFVHTDLAPADAKELLQRLEVMIDGMSKYWGRPPVGVIECYVVEDLSKWPDGAIPADGLMSIQGGAGVTLTQKLSRGSQWVAKAVVYAVSDRGTPQHEAVHAYCGQTFGETGPLWYAEGMAEMGNYWKDGERGVACRQEVVDYLKNSPAKTIHDIVNAQEITGDSWQNYAWRWALCHLLDQNENYQDEFRQLGLAFLNEKEVSFEQVYGARADQIQFEYRFFLEHIDIGYRVDLCSWDWKRKFLPLRSGSTITARIAAGQGWQPTSIEVSTDQQVSYVATGSWQTSKESKKVGADGGEDGAGKLVGIVLKDYKLSEPFELGKSGTFTPPSDGRLFLRCSDAWNELADNKGVMTVKLKLAK